MTNMRIRYEDVQEYITKDGSTIRELIHPLHGQSKNQSLAEATVPTDCKTRLHKHNLTEEIYHIIRGCGLMTMDDISFPVKEGDSVLIKPGTKHCIENTGDIDLTILCCCAPAYSHEDTELIMI